MARLELMMMLDDYDRKNAQLEVLDTMIEELCMQIPEVGKILGIKGVGLATVAGFFAEVGDIRRFDSPKQIRKLAGLAIRENSSGKHKGKSGISKRGRKRLRTILFRVVLPMVGKNREFRELHEYYTTRRNNPLKKKQSLIVLSCKLIRIIYGMSTKGFHYDGRKLLDDIVRPGEVMVA
jgi:transposase